MPRDYLWYEDTTVSTNLSSSDDLRYASPQHGSSRSAIPGRFVQAKALELSLTRHETTPQIAVMPRRRL